MTYGAYFADALATLHEERRYRVFAAQMEQAAYGYFPGDYDGAVALFQPAERLAVLDSRPGWAEVVRGTLESHDIPGTHGTMAEPPNVATFAARLNDALDRLGRPAG